MLVIDTRIIMRGQPRRQCCSWGGGVKVQLDPSQKQKQKNNFIYVR